VKYGGGCHTLVNDGKLSRLVLEGAKELFGEDRVCASNELGGDAREKEGGSEDFAYVSQVVPSVMIALAAGEKGKGFVYPLHHPKAKFDEKALPVGAALYAGVAQKILNET
jgi:hippurate hydrolase